MYTSFVRGSFLLALFMLLLNGSLFAQQKPYVVAVPLTPCLIDETPAQLRWLERETASSEIALQHRQAMLDAWETIKQRNTDSLFDQMLVQEPKIGSDGALTWRFGMVERFDASLNAALKASREGRAPFIPPFRDEDGDIGIVAANGAIVMIDHLFNSVLVRQDLESEDSILDDIPLRFAVIEDWLEGEDTFFSFHRHIERGMMTIAIESTGPNLGPALRSFRSPYRLTKDRFVQRKYEFLFAGRNPPEYIDRLLDLQQPDQEVLKDCEAILINSYRRALNWSEYWADSAEEWLKKVERDADTNREYLISTGIETSTIANMHPYRLAVLAAVARFDDFAKLHEELLSLPIHEAVAKWREAIDPASPKTRAYPKHLCEISRSFAMFYADEAWYTEQGVRAAAVAYYLRNHLAVHGCLPAKLEQLDAGECILDPITNQPFEYHARLPRRRLWG